MTISLDLMKSSEVRKAGDRSEYVCIMYILCINAPTIFKKGKLEDFVRHAFVEIKQLKGGKEIKKNVPLNGTIRYQDNENTE